jgi:alanine dehydrogenase
MPLWLNEADVRALLPMRDLIETTSRAVAAFSAQQVTQPVRTVFAIPGGFFAAMPACIRAGEPALGAKLVTVCHHNADHGLPSHLATILLMDPKTGALLAVMDGRYITEARTAAASAVAVRLLALENAGTLAILGTGVQARSHLQALTLVRRFAEIRVWSPTRAKLEKFVSESTGYPIRAAATAEEAVRGADVIALATSSSAPVLDDAWVNPGACVVSVGACRPSEREMDPALVARSRLYVDSRAAALTESGDIVQGIREGRFGESHIQAELGELVANPALGRTSADQVTIFKSLGIAVEDVAAAALIYTRAVSAGKGQPLD